MDHSVLDNLRTKNRALGESSERCRFWHSLDVSFSLSSGNLSKFLSGESYVAHYSGQKKQALRCLSGKLFLREVF